MEHPVDVPPPEQRPLFDVDLAISPTEARVTLRGELDIASTDRLRAALATVAASAPPEVRIDLAELRFIDAAGIGELVRLHIELTAAGRRVTLDHARAGLLRTLRLAEADWLLE